MSWKVFAIEFFFVENKTNDERSSRAATQFHFGGTKRYFYLHRMVSLWSYATILRVHASMLRKVYVVCPQNFWIVFRCILHFCENPVSQSLTHYKICWLPFTWNFHVNCVNHVLRDVNWASPWNSSAMDVSGFSPLWQFSTEHVFSNHFRIIFVCIMLIHFLFNFNSIRIR